MQVNPKSGVLLIQKHKNTAVRADITIVQDDEDKRLITGTVLEGSADYPKGTTVIFGRYAIYNLTIKGEDFYLIEEDDIIAVSDYTEDVI